MLLPINRLLKTTLIFLIFLAYPTLSFSNTETRVGTYAQLERERLSFINRYQGFVVNVLSSQNLDDFFSTGANIRGIGSGFIYKDTNYIVTSTNAISDVNSIEITFHDGKKWPARLVGVDHDTGIAVLEALSRDRINNEVKQTFLPSSAIKVGQQVFVLGNTCGRGTSFISTSVVSPPKTLRASRGNFLDDLIEIDKNLHASWGGAPAFDLNGNIIGMYSKLQDLITNQGSTGYLIPVETIEIIVDTIIKKGAVRRPWLGVKLISLTPQLASIMSLPINEGAVITEVTKKSPAEMAGLRGPEREIKIGNRTIPIGSDIILSIDGELVDSDKTAQRILLKKNIGDEVVLSVYRDKQIVKVKVKLDEKR